MAETELGGVEHLKAGMPQTDANEQAEKEWLMLEPESESDDEEQSEKDWLLQGPKNEKEEDTSLLRHDDVDCRDDEGRFPLSIDDKPKIERLVKLVRSQLFRMSPSDLRAAASVLFALERLPATIPGVMVTFGFSQPNNDGNYGWVDIAISEDEFRLSEGEHFYDPSVGGDTETRTKFETEVGGNRCRGDIDDWLSVACVIACAGGEIDAEDHSEHDEIDWEADVDPNSWDGAQVSSAQVDDHREL
jgi:hypothetical protein